MRARGCTGRRGPAGAGVGPAPRALGGPSDRRRGSPRRGRQRYRTAGPPRRSPLRAGGEQRARRPPRAAPRGRPPRRSAPPTACARSPTALPRHAPASSPHALPARARLAPRAPLLRPRGRRARPRNRAPRPRTARRPRRAKSGGAGRRRSCTRGTQTAATSAPPSSPARSSGDGRASKLRDRARRSSSVPRVTSS